MDIITLPVEIDTTKIDSRYRLVIMTAQRAQMLSEGQKPLIPTKSVKVSTVALDEALEGKLEVLTGEDAKKARQDAKKAEAQRIAAEAERREEMGAELSALEKDLKFYLNEKEEKEKKAIEDLFSPGVETASNEKKSKK